MSRTRKYKKYWDEDYNENLERRKRDKMRRKAKEIKKEYQNKNLEYKEEDLEQNY